MPSGDSDAYIYHVMRHTDDYHNGGSETEIRGTYVTLKEANAAARVDLTKDWSMDFFDTYEVEVEDGMVSVTAECPEGEVMNVYVERKAAPNLVGSRAKGTKEKKAAEPVRALKEVWIIMQTDYAHHTDEEGRSDIACSTAYESVREANKAAREVLCDACGVEDEDELEAEVELEEQNRESATKGYVGYATVYEDDRHQIKVEVRKLAVKHAVAGTKRRSASGSDTTAKKKRKIEAEEVIDISSDD
ncbi:hypothetical protein B0H17DRAFT_1091287 [Mycena rosella]|uniref:Uncharacterized protein n=1 Tax=Mycena rosella TaxID=1033263 RepID=A0AAD7G6P7_MYCRO|nr:hypothetical protein B0H17DRAFT_1091287 [Mycena rosella]